MKLTEEDIVALIASVDAGRSTIACVGETWREVWAGDCTFRVVAGEFAGWEIVWFNDCDSWDYVDHVTAPDGRLAVFPEIDAMPRVPRHPGNPAIWESAPRL